MNGLDRRGFLRFCGSGAAVTCLGGIYALGIEPVWLQTVRRDVVLPGLDPAFDGYTIAQLSDLHVGCGVPGRLLRDAVARVNRARPDLVALTGDFVHRGARGDLAERAGEVLAPLAASDGVLAVLGNHDAGCYGGRRVADQASMRQVAGALREGGVRVLDNERVRITRAGARLDVAGFGDLWSDAFTPWAVPVDGVTIALSHNPDTAPELAGRGMSLVLAGHTHGGQVWIPGIGAPILPVRHKEFVAGHYPVGDGQLYVNRGLGWLRRVRLFTRPEVTVLTLRPA